MLQSLFRRAANPKKKPAAPEAAKITWWPLLRGPILALVVTALVTLIGPRLATEPLNIAGRQALLLREFEAALLPLQSQVSLASAGDESAGAALTLSVDQQKKRLAELNQATAALRDTVGFALWSAGRGERGAEIDSALTQLSQEWRVTEQAAQTLIQAGSALGRFRSAVTAIDQAAQAIAALSVSVTPQIESRLTAHQLLLTALMAQRIAQSNNRLFAARTLAEWEELSAQLKEQRDQFKNLLAAVDPSTQSPFIQGRINEVLEAARLLDEALEEALTLLPAFVTVQAEVTELLRRIPALQQGAIQLYGLVEKELETGQSSVNLILILAAVAVLGIFLQLVKNYINLQAAQREKEQAERAKAEEENRRTQEAILRLLNEMADLADGDLTVRATVTEDITGAIADSVNFAIEELGTLVRRINETAEAIAEASAATRERSSALLATAQQQSEEITEADALTQEVAQALNRAADGATQAAGAARRSLDAAQQGTVAVNQSVTGMDRIREQIQETAKRIKRLGESSQEIGEIVELISDITEQTNVLALNAAIQAAAAGEAGRGFSVVAEEVQWLAERSAEATRQIAALVRTIQTDTQETIAAMEATTQEVVHGTSLSQEARQALDEIARTSRETTERIVRVTQEIQAQAQRGEAISRLMRDVLALTQSTRSGTEETAAQIERLAELAAELRGSVAGFRV